jgi:hypothetical protein
MTEEAKKAITYLLARYNYTELLENIAEICYIYPEPLSQLAQCEIFSHCADEVYFNSTNK